MLTPLVRLRLDQATAKRVVDVLDDAFPFGEASVSAFETGPDSWWVEIYGGPEAGADELALALREALGPESAGLRIESDSIEDTDWIAKSLEGLAPVPAGRFLIHGSHDRARVPLNAIGIEIEAALAFGTGHHGTTRGCLLAIDGLLKRRRFHHALDLGTGTGVLAIGLALAQKAPVLATDIDPVSVRVAADNARANGAGAYVETACASGFGHPRFAARAPFDLIVANILARPLMKLATEVADHLEPGGIVVLSGLMTTEERMVRAAYAARGLRHVATGRLQGWSTLTLAG